MLARHIAWRFPYAVWLSYWHFEVLWKRPCFSVWEVNQEEERICLIGNIGNLIIYQLVINWLTLLEFRTLSWIFLYRLTGFKLFPKDILCPLLKVWVTYSFEIFESPSKAPSGKLCSSLPDRSLRANFRFQAVRLININNVFSCP